MYMKLKYASIIVKNIGAFTRVKLEIFIFLRKVNIVFIRHFAVWLVRIDIQRQIDLIQRQWLALAGPRQE